MKNAFPPAWLGALDDGLRTLLERIEARLDDETRRGATIFPSAALRYRALEAVAPEAVRAVIIGQDPYHAAGQAMGLCFSVPREVRVPPSLRNVYKELEADLRLPAPAHGDLTAWTKQGVLLLNTSLSVAEGRAGSHADYGWARITEAIVRHASRRSPPSVFLLWGNHARNLAPAIDASKHRILASGHPSPLSVRHFLGCAHFSQANAFLETHGRGTIDWSL